MIKRFKNSIFRGSIVLWLLLGITSVSYAQQNKGMLKGSVSYISGKNIYVKFERTQGIENGDTLFMQLNNSLTPVLVVRHHSSISCLCNPLDNLKFQVSDVIYAVNREKVTDGASMKNEVQHPKTDVNEQVLQSKATKPKTFERTAELSGRLSASLYSNFTSQGANDDHRFRYTLSMDAEHISNSKISAETYISFSHRLHQWDVVKQNINNALKIYNLALKYEFNATTFLWVGRKINPKIANVGAIDGIQFQYGFKKMFAGVAVGSRPDYSDYGYNLNLYEYGAYVGQSQRVKNGFVQTSLGFFEQRNKGNIDRRFAYFQHTNTLLKNVNVFSSFEVDLFKLENGLPKNTVSLTSLYFSLRYRVSKKLSVYGSYDNRKNVIYYETFRNYVDQLLQQASRQGLRFRINYRPFNRLILSVNAGARFQKGDPRPTKTLNSFVTYSSIPGLQASLTLTTNFVQTAYLNGQIYGLRLSKNFYSGKLYGSLSYRHTGFQYASSPSSFVQHIGELNMSYQVNRKWYFSVNLEATLEKNINYFRSYLNLRRRF
ncbi:MAG: hypothetical protein JXR71_12595 [Bacteroidales bacterium]|nr:hypothetical protein [Bacteroidales bacterium]